MSGHAQATLFAYFAMAVFPLLGLLFDAKLPRHRAVLATMFVGFLFLPSIRIDLLGLINWDRTTAPFLVVMIGVVFRDLALLKQFRLRWFDIPMLVWCCAPFFSAVSSGYGVYEGFSLFFYQTLRWGGPYFLGRLHFQRQDQLLDLAFTLVLGGLIYAPLCVFEMRFSPQLHNYFYGFQQHSFGQTIRGSYYRPMVFLQHGLVVAMWMGMAAFIGWVLATAKLGPRLLGVPWKLLILLLAGVFLIIPSLGAILLTLVAWFVVFLSRGLGRNAFVLTLALAPIAWSLSRATGVLDSASVNSVASVFSADRAQSLAFRLKSEDLLVKSAQRSPIFGKSPRGFSLIDGEEGGTVHVVTDGLWLIAFVAYGWVGLIAILLVHFVPVLFTLRRAPPRYWASEPILFVAGALGVLVAVVSVDNMVNAFINPFFLLIMGALPTTLGGSGTSPDQAELLQAKQATLQRFGRIMGSRSDRELP